MRFGPHFAACLFLLCVPGAASADGPATKPPAGLREHTPDVHALVGARLVIAPGKVIERGTLVIRDGHILAAGADLSAPDDARVWDLEGRSIYPGLIDAYSELPSGTVKVNGAAYWNPNVTPQLNGAEVYSLDAAANKKYRSQGVTARLAAPSERIVKGTSVLVTTGDDELARVILREAAALHVRLNPAGRNRKVYPNSPMGAVALVRQAFYDADWYRKAWAAYRDGGQHVARPERNNALAALADHRAAGGLVVVDAPDELYFLRADRIAREFKLRVAVRGSGNEYRRLEAVKATGRAVIVPVNFPKAPNVKSPELAAAVPLEELLHWDLAPENPARLAKAGVTIALTAHGLKDTGKFLEQVRTAVERGLPEDAALRALTTAPAELYGVSDRLGTLEVGKAANLVVTDGDLFARKTKVLQTWVDGRRYEVVPSPTVDPRGTWELTVAGQGEQTAKFTIELEGEPGKLKGTIAKAAEDGEEKKEKNAEAKEPPAVDLKDVQLDGARLSFAFPGKDLKLEGVVQGSATLSIDDNGGATWLGALVAADGVPAPMSARRTAALQAENTSEVARQEDGEQKPEAKKRAALYEVNFPLGGFGRSGPPAQPKTLLLAGGTVWTCGRQGVLDGADVLVEDGRIKQIGKNIQPPEGAVVVDVKGMHLSPGLIDCHSHIATDGGVNESAQTITAEVRIGDFIDSDDVNIYRQLAGGVTSSNILHGSANTIGGQNQVIKMRWGALPEEIKFARAPQGIKFALGENVKQSNWGDDYTSRYPQTRMGVEQLVRNAFEAAREYAARWDAWRKEHQGPPPRVDLELEALSEVLSGERLIHCHSYRQDEILALMRTCEDFGVKIGTFQHILEGYKVADVMARHGVGGSSFSDWWAYKFEVYDAIPYNGSIMHNAGVVVSFNSDDAELARRLNTEAAKAVKYGGVPEEEALKFVTLNPAIQLGVGRWVGSLEPGKDADLVVWSGPPLSSLSRCEQTWIEGRKYFDRAEDVKQRAETRAVRSALVQRILSGGAEMAAPGESSKPVETIWVRHDEFCHHGHDHDGHGRDHED